MSYIEATKNKNQQRSLDTGLYCETSMALEDVIRQARSFISMNDFKQALKVLKPYKKFLQNENANNIPLLEVYADIYLEDGKIEKAYSLLIKACELDSTGKIGGCGKFFTLGQIIGGIDGVHTIRKGIENIYRIYEARIPQDQVDMVISGLLSMIEIWMTDLCMEADAESQCEEAITKALEISEGKSPEAWSMLGSIRISQQNIAEAATALTKAWEFFQQKKKMMEQALKGEISIDNPKLHADYIELLQPLLSLAKMSVELGLYDNAIQILFAVKDLDEDNIEAYYLEGFIYYLTCKLDLFKIQNPTIDISPANVYEFNQKFQDLPLELTSEALQESIHDARIALSFALKLGENCDPEDEVSQELIQGAHSLLVELGGSVDVKELIKVKHGDDINEQDELDLNTIEE
ncbi:HBR090Wp [Eremothecium sinecaudum]|uniref:HBR090Wp n=1 Tax=Eremothecium sinecaudum TaxID=45286 RepID=A0A120K152_9SACH|nr:HBR090Wp [Eremothecium sinecaudum]AMD18991.1 HBR090Wp [Eremothecium sinecaudum]